MTDLPKLHENWVNGNRKNVVEEILALPKARACAVTAEFYANLASRRPSECYTFLTLLDAAGT